MSLDNSPYGPLVTTPGMLPRARATSVGTLVAAVLLTLLWVTPARADYTALCTGYVDCRDAGFGNAGYQGANDRSWWRMYTGHNCTNYAAYRMVKAGLPNDRPWSGGGNAENWGLEMASITDDTPMVGAVAWWGENVRPAGSSGHVAYVERVISSTEIWISEDSWGGDFHWRSVTKAGGGWPSGFIHFADVALKSKKPPAVSGTPEVGETLTAAPGAWTPTPTTYSYQWLADGKPVAGVTAATFVLGANRVGKQISVEVAARQAGYAAAEATSSPTPAVAPGQMAPAEKPAITGEALVGKVLTASKGIWSPDARSRTVQWLSDGKPVAGATGWSFTPGPDQAGTRMSVVVTAKRAGYDSSTVTSASTESVLGGEVTLTEPFSITGTPRIGKRLSAVPGTFEPASADVAYTWLRDGAPIAGADGPTYDLVAADVGATISLRVDVTHDGYKPASQTTDPSAAVRTVPDVRVSAKGGKERATVTVVVRAPGVDTVTGRVEVRVAKRVRTVRLVDGRVIVVIRQVPPGSRPVVVRYLGEGLVDPGRARGQVQILRG
ncbi:MAG: domain containing protein [Nocardioides sp.]|nr:domain containing protein [Nocardioides sp.]